ncbi:winged helix-turn-helix domain-containing protein [Candidatus Enterococcus mansonii]|uniref:OmpR/PhoB-type domain-containing protein n=1 Tax=Candidatus Enterococcus mansonii TaxID=1834181 RepID=A0ABU8IFX8_9ENTE
MYKVGWIKMSATNSIENFDMEKLKPISFVQFLGFPDKNARKELDALIIDGSGYSPTKELMIIQWLLQETLPMVWIYMKEAESSIVDMYASIGVNGILTTNYSFESIGKFIRNTLQKKQVVQSKNLDKKQMNNSKVDLNKKNISIIVNGREIFLTTREFNMLYFLRSHANQTVSYRELFQKVWPNEVYQREVSNYRIANIISKVRKKIEIDSSKPKLIKTTRSIGYVFKE